MDGWRPGNTQCPRQFWSNKRVVGNQTHILNAVQNLNERLLAIEEKVDDEKLNDLKDITETQGMIDALIVKNSDDITRLIKQKTENNEIIRSLETKIDMLKEN